MNIIRKYVEALLAEFPLSEALTAFKENLLHETDEKYDSLLGEGKTDKVAVGMVIAEYGDITERYKLLLEKQVDQTPTIRTLYKQEGEAYLSAKKNAAWMISMGIVLCVLCVAVLVSLNMTREEALTFLGDMDRGVIGLVVLFVMIAVAVAPFIYSGVRMKKHEEMNNKFRLDKGYESSIREQSECFEKTYTLTLITGVVLCVLSPLVLIVPTSFQQKPGGTALFVFFIIIAIAVFLLSFFGIIRDGYRYLLRIGEYSKEQQEKKELVYFMQLYGLWQRSFFYWPALYGTSGT